MKYKYIKCLFGFHDFEQFYIVDKDVTFIDHKFICRICKHIIYRNILKKLPKPSSEKHTQESNI